MKQRIIRTIMRPLLIVGVVLGLIRVVEADVSNIDFTNKYAWGTNVGWINFNPTLGVTVYNDHLEGYAWGENIGWIRLGTSEGGGAHTYGNTSMSDYGVNNDGSGNLSGYAWSANTGWINFNPADGGVTAYNDHLEGYAWAENVGWIRFGTQSSGSNHRYGNSSQSDYGVNLNPGGHLAGYAWGTNVGWINFGSIESGGVAVYPDHLEGYAWGENIGWIRMGTNTGGGTHTYGNSSNTNYGVNRDCSTSQLSGSAWGTNVGWINFNPTSPSGNGVTVNAETGEFDGYAWGENIGWIHFKNSSGTAYHVEFVTDTLTIEAATPKSYSVGCGATQVTVNVTNTGSCLTGLSIKRIAGNAPNAPTGIQDGQHWQITPTGCTTGFTVDLTLPHSNSVSQANARACRYDSGTSSWDCDAAGSNSSSNGSYVTRTGVTGFSTWAVGDVSQPLAVTLANFSAEASEDGVNINWETVSEQNNLGFNLYRATSLDGQQIRLNSDLIAPQAPGSGQGSAYEWQDESVAEGLTYYYWLEDLDINGDSTTHGPVSATVNVPTAVTVSTLESKQPNQAAWLLGFMALTLLAGTIWHKRRGHKEAKGKKSHRQSSLW